MEDHITDTIPIDELWKRYHATRMLEDKNALLVHYVELVKRVVRRMMPTYRTHNEYDDLLSYGILGLIDALDRYDPSVGIKFETYASKRIRGEILDHMRKQDWAPSSLRRKINRISSAYTDLEMEFHRPATDDEVARHLEMDVDDVRKTLDKTYIFNVLYFEDFLTDSYADCELTQSTEEAPAVQAEKKELAEILGKMIDDLPQNERTVVTLYYFEELTLKEIAQVLKVTESRVSQIHSKVLAKLRERLQRTFEI